MEEFVGAVKVFLGTYAPTGFLDCDGRLLSVNQYQVLYSILGNAYGGDGANTFALPDLRPRDKDGRPQPWHPGQPRSIVCVEGVYPSRSE